jgi:hypothetical protein
LAKYLGEGTSPESSERKFAALFVFAMVFVAADSGGISALPGCSDLRSQIMTKNVSHAQFQSNLTERSEMALDYQIEK